MMRQISWVALCGIVLCSASVWASGRVSFFLTRPVQPVMAANFLNIEHPFRCEDRSLGEQNISAVIPVGARDFKLTRFASSDALPRFEVNGFSFENMPVDEAIQELVEEAGITVYTDDGAYPEMSGKDVYGELSQVVSEMAAMGGVSYSYDASKKSLFLAKYGRYELTLPRNRLVMFAVLDAIRGANITTSVPNWDRGTIMLTLNQPERETVEALVGDILRESKLLLLDVGVYRVNAPDGKDVQWQNVVGNFGFGRVHSLDGGLIGRIMTMGHSRNSDSMLAALRTDNAVKRIAQGVSVVPHNWKMRFDVGRCVAEQDDLNSLSFLLSANVKSSDVIETDIALDTLSGEIASFKSIAGLDDEVVIVGIPASLVQSGRTGELVITLKVRIIRLMSEGK